jgi:hypothetical protein
MSIKSNIIVTAMAGLALGASSCGKYLDVNNNPNVAQNATVKTLLPSAELYLGAAMGTDLQINGSIWAQYWTQGPDGKEYISLDQYDPKAEAYNMGWHNLYTGASNFYQLYKIADEQFKGQYKAIALLMQAYTFQTLADGWGDVPFTEALKGQYADGHLVNPKYDSQRVVYRGIVTQIDSALGMINTSDANGPSSDDIIYGGDMNKWRKFGNTLKLRTLLRIADVDPVYAKEKMDAMFAKNPQFIGDGEDAVIHYASATGNNNPLYAELSSTALSGAQQLAASKTIIDTLVANNDVRGFAFYTSTGVNGLVGINQSEFDVKLPSGSYSIPSSAVGADKSNMGSAIAPVHLLTSWESHFLQSEAFARGLATGNDAQAYYDGVRASFNYYGNAILAATGVTASVAFTNYMTATPANYWAVFPTTGTVAERVRYIATQKWFAMCGNQGFEAWTEWRRTGYPDFLVSPKNSRIGTKMPLRFLYPASERSTNSQYPGEQPVTKNVWWDVL